MQTRHMTGFVRHRQLRSQRAVLPEQGNSNRSFLRARGAGSHRPRGPIRPSRRAQSRSARRVDRTPGQSTRVLSRESKRNTELCAQTHAPITLVLAARDSSNVAKFRRDHVQQEREPIRAPTAPGGAAEGFVGPTARAAARHRPAAASSRAQESAEPIRIPTRLLETFECRTRAKIAGADS